VSEEVRQYVRECHLLFKVPFLLTIWQFAPEMREKLAIDMGMHIMSLKLGDDLVDNDMGVHERNCGTWLSADAPLSLRHTTSRR
jgi:hypothetical protein